MFAWGFISSNRGGQVPTCRLDLIISWFFLPSNLCQTARLRNRVLCGLWLLHQDTVFLSRNLHKARRWSFLSVKIWSGLQQKFFCFFPEDVYCRTSLLDCAMPSCLPIGLHHSDGWFCFNMLLLYKLSLLRVLLCLHSHFIKRISNIHFGKLQFGAVFNWFNLSRKRSPRKVFPS